MTNDGWMDGGFPHSFASLLFCQHFVFYRGRSPTTFIKDSRRKESFLEPMGALPFSSRWPMEDQYLAASEYSHLPPSGLHAGDLSSSQENDVRSFSLQFDAQAPRDGWVRSPSATTGLDDENEYTRVF